MLAVVAFFFLIVFFMKLSGISALKEQDGLSNTQRTDFPLFYTLYTIEWSVPSLGFPCKWDSSLSMCMKNTFHKTPNQLISCSVASVSAAGNSTCKTELISAFSLSHLNHFFTSLRLILKKKNAVFLKVCFLSCPYVHFYGQHHTVASLSFELLVSEGWIFVVSCRGNP